MEAHGGGGVDEVDALKEDRGVDKEELLEALIEEQAIAELEGGVGGCLAGHGGGDGPVAAKGSALNEDDGDGGAMGAEILDEGDRGLEDLGGVHVVVAVDDEGGGDGVVDLDEELGD